jgi:hypothetical protein
VDEVIVAAADSEPNAEVIAGRLRAEGLAVRVRYDSQAGIPRQIAPAGPGFGPGAFRVAVSASDAALAREILGASEPPPHRDRPVVRIVSLVVLALTLLAFLQGVVQLGPLLLGR